MYFIQQQSQQSKQISQKFSVKIETAKKIPISNNNIQSIKKQRNSNRLEPKQAYMYKPTSPPLTTNLRHNSPQLRVASPAHTSHQTPSYQSHQHIPYANSHMQPHPNYQSSQQFQPYQHQPIQYNIQQYQPQLQGQSQAQMQQPFQKSQQQLQSLQSHPQLRHTVQLERMNSPKSLHSYDYQQQHNNANKRATHRVQLQYGTLDNSIENIQSPSYPSPITQYPYQPQQEFIPSKNPKKPQSTPLSSYAPNKNYRLSNPNPPQKRKNMKQPPRQFITNHHTPRMTTGYQQQQQYENQGQYQNQNQYQYQYQQGNELHYENQQGNGNQYQYDHNSYENQLNGYQPELRQQLHLNIAQANDQPIQKISIISGDFHSKFSNSKKSPVPSPSTPSNPINYAIQTQRHSHKRKHKHSQVGPITKKIQEMPRHRRLATMAQQGDQSKTGTQEEKGLEDEDFGDYEDSQLPEQNQYQYDNQYQQQQQYQPPHTQYITQQPQPLYYPQPQYPQQVQSPNFKKKPNSPPFPYLSQPQSLHPYPSQSPLQQQIQTRLRDIESLMSTQTQNLKQHNQYLLAVIKKLQSKDRKNRIIIQNQGEIIENLKEEKNAYMERCMQLQIMISGQAQGQAGHGIVKQYSVLNFQGVDNGLRSVQSSTTSDANNQTVKFNNLDPQHERQLREHLKNTLTQKSHNPPKTPVSSSSNLQPCYPATLPNASSQTNPGPKPNPPIPSLPLSTLPPASQLQPYLSSQTPKFSSHNESPTRKPRLTAKISNSSNNSDPGSTIFNPNSSGIMGQNQSHSFGGGWINTISGFNVVRQLRDELPKGLDGIGLGELGEEGDREVESEEVGVDTQRGREEGDEDGDEETNQNSSQVNAYNVRYATNTDQQAVQELNNKFQQLMKVYRVNHDVGIRKQCVQIAKKIKQLKTQVQKNKQYQQKSPHNPPLQSPNPNINLHSTRVRSSATPNTNPYSHNSNSNQNSIQPQSLQKKANILSHRRQPNLQPHKSQQSQQSGQQYQNQNQYYQQQEQQSQLLQKQMQ